MADWLSWWSSVAQQLEDVWHQLVFQLELATAGAQDVQWVDTLVFFWDSLPDGDKLTAKEKRRIAASLKHLVAEQSHDLYHKQQSHKETISRRQDMLAQQHLELLAHKRLQQMKTMSYIAREQSMLLPAPSELLAAAGLEQQQAQQWEGNGWDAAGSSGGCGSSSSSSIGHTNILLQQQQQPHWPRQPGGVGPQQRLLSINEQPQQQQQQQQGLMGQQAAPAASVIINIPAQDFCFQTPSTAAAAAAAATHHRPHNSNNVPTSHSSPFAAGTVPCSSSSAINSSTAVTSSSSPWWLQRQAQKASPDELAIPLLEQQQVHPSGADEIWASQEDCAAAAVTGEATGLYQAPSLQHVELPTGQELWACLDAPTAAAAATGGWYEPPPLQQQLQAPVVQQRQQPHCPELAPAGSVASGVCGGEGFEQQKQQQQGPAQPLLLVRYLSSGDQEPGQVLTAPTAAAFPAAAAAAAQGMDTLSSGSFADALLSIQSQHSIGASSSRSSKSDDSSDSHHAAHQHRDQQQQWQQQQRWLGQVVVGAAAVKGTEVQASRSSSDTTAGAVDTPTRAAAGEGGRGGGRDGGVL